MALFSSVRIPAAIATLSLSLAGGAIAQSALTAVPGTGVSLRPPKGMVVSKTFSGFEDRDSSASILVAEFPPEAYPQILQGFTPEGLAASGLKAGGPAVDTPVAGGQGGRLLKGQQVAQGITFDKWVMLAKGPANTVMISAQVPESKRAAQPAAAIEAALKSVALKAPPGIEEQISTLPYSVSDRSGFRAVRVMSGSALLLTDGPRDQVTDASQPVVIVASALDGGNAGQSESARVLLARQAFATIGGVSDLTVDRDSTFERDGATWIRMDGRGTYRNTLEPVYLIQLIRFTPTGYIRIIGIARSTLREKIGERVEQLSYSVKPK